MKRQDSLQKILEDLSLVPYLRRKRSNTENNENVSETLVLSLYKTRLLRAKDLWERRKGRQTI